MSNRTAILVLALLVTAGFTLATVFQPHVLAWSSGTQSDGLFKAFFGEGRRLFAKHFFEQADISFHSGYYPSIFDRRELAGAKHMAGEESGADEHAHDQAPGEPDGHEQGMDFLKEPKDWIERFGRHFQITEHTHLEGGKEREILPWLKLSAELDPQRVETYTVAAYWLRERLNKVKEAEQFLRQGLQTNPSSYEILYELGRLYSENHHDTNRARNLWELALRRWREQAAARKEPDDFALESITASLARLEENAGNLVQSVEYLEIAKSVSPAPDTLQKQIDELRLKLALPPSPVKTNAPQ